MLNVSADARQYSDTPISKYRYSKGSTKLISFCQGVGDNRRNFHTSCPLVVVNSALSLGPRAEISSICPLTPAAELHTNENPSRTGLGFARVTLAG